MINQKYVPKCYCSSAIIKVTYSLCTSRTEAERPKDAFQLQDSDVTAPNKGLEEKDGDEPSGNTIITISDSSELEVGRSIGFSKILPLNENKCTYTVNLFLILLSIVLLRGSPHPTLRKLSSDC